MKKDKLMYNPPVVEPLVIRFEGWVCQGSPAQVNASRADYGSFFDLGDDDDLD